MTMTKPSPIPYLLLLILLALPSSLGFVSERKLDVAVHPQLVVFRADCVQRPNHNFPHLLAAQQVQQEAEDDKARKQTALLNTGVGGLVLAGGIAGFLRKGSKASLIAGSSFGGILLTSAGLIWNKKPWGYKLASVASLLLSIVMGKKYFASGVYMPAGLIATMGVIAFVYNSVDTLVVGSTEGTTSDEAEEKTGE